MDERLRRLEREGAAPAERLRARVRLGEDEVAVWRGLIPEAADYGEAVALTRELRAFRWDGLQTFASGGARYETARFVHVETELRFVLVPGGAFEMGARPDEPKTDGDERPKHRVEVRPFLLAETPCTQAAWDRHRARLGLEDSRSFRGPERPMEKVDFVQSEVFCRGVGLELPSEAEWEYACRAGTNSRFYFGDDEAHLPDHAWYRGNQPQETRPVGLKIPNAFGLFDMLGNVWEWCEDDWHGDYTGAPQDGSAWVDAERTDTRIRRGGSWWHEAKDARCSFRYYYEVGDTFYDLGFRPALSARPRNGSGG